MYNLCLLVIFNTTLVTVKSGNDQHIIRIRKTDILLLLIFCCLPPKKKQHSVSQREELCLWPLYKFMFTPFTVHYF